MGRDRLNMTILERERKSVGWRGRGREREGQRERKSGERRRDYTNIISKYINK